MITIRFAAFALAATCLIALAITPNSPATLILAGFFFACFGTVAWTCRGIARENEIGIQDA